MFSVDKVYHFSYYIKDEITNSKLCKRLIFSGHTLIPYIIYHSTYPGIITTWGAFVWVIIFISICQCKTELFVFSADCVYNTVNSCYLNKETCKLCY